MRNKKAKSLMALALTAVMGFSQFSVTAYATETEPEQAEVEQTEPTPENVIGGGEDYHGNVDVPYEAPESIYEGPSVEYGTGNIPASYDAREHGVVTSIKNQNPYGSCWSFSTMAALESSLLSQGIYDDIDLSEYHLVNYTFNSVADPLGGTSKDGASYSGTMEQALDAGGNVTVAYHALKNWMGAVEEEDAVYPGKTGVVEALPKTVENAYLNDVVHLQQAYIMNKSDVNAIKQSIMDYGTVTGSFYYDSNYMTGDAYYINNQTKSNHAVAIVGWDDNYDKSNFGSTQPSANGAWLVKNSWDTWFGNAGYCWLSYEDTSLQDTICALIGEPADNYDNNYQYDGSYFNSYYTLSEAVAANVFQVQDGQGTELLEAVAFETGSPNMNYSIQIYTDMTDAEDPTSGTAMLAQPLGGTVTFQGYHTIKLPTAIELEANQTFSVVVELDKNGEDFRFPVESTYTWNNISFTAGADAGQSLLQYDGYDYWWDIGGEEGTNIRVKAFTSNVTPQSNDFVIENGVLIAYNGTSEIVEIPDTVTEIDGEVFYGNNVIREVVIPDSVETIGALAFQNCSNLETVTFGTGLKTIETYGFFNCSKLTEIDLPDTVEHIGYSAFMNCSNLVSVDLGKSLKTIESNAFQACPITEITLPDTLENLSSYVFYKCNALEKVVVSDNLTTIGTGAFQDCTSLTTIEVAVNKELIKLMHENAELIYKVIFKSGISELSNAVLLGNQYVKEVVVPEGVTFIGSQFFADSVLEVVYLPSTLTEISDHVFAGTNLKEVDIPDNVSKIGAEAFYDCDELISVELPAKLEKLDLAAFGSCDALPEVEIPRRLVDTYAPFGNCKKLKTITLESGTTKIPNYLLMNCVALESFEIPSTVTTIGIGAFQGCTALTDIVIPDTVETMENEAFKGCSSLEEVTISNSLYIIPMYAFEGTALKKVVIPEKVESIDYRAFKDCKELTEVIIPGSVDTIGESAFENCTKLTKVELVAGENGTYSLSQNSFKGCTALAEVKLGEGISQIADSAFEDCTALSEVILPRGVVSIEKDAFAYCSGLTKIYIPESVTGIDIDAFCDDENLTIYGANGSYAQTYAEENSIPFVAENVAIEDIVLKESEKTIELGEHAYLYADIFPSNYTDTEVVWTSSDESVISLSEKMDESVLLYAMKEGTATVTVTTGGISDSCVVTVINSNVVHAESVTLSETEKTVKLGDKSFSLQATPSPADCTDTPMWISSNPSVAVVNGMGNPWEATVTIVGIGSTNIVVNVGNYSATCVVTVIDPIVPATGISLLVEEYTMDIASLYDVVATVTPEDCTDEITWTSSNENVAVVWPGEMSHTGRVNSVGVGTTTITATIGAYSDSCVITVVDPSNVPATGVTLSVKEHTMDIYSLYDILAIITPVNTTDVPVWTSSDESVATVGIGDTPSVGRVNSVGVGTATITVTVGEFSDSCTITVVNPLPEEPKDGLTAFVERMYTVALGRAAEEDGLNFYVEKLLNGDSNGACLAESFLGSPEFKNKNHDNTQYVNVLYATFFDREPATEEVNYWVDIIKSGQSREFVLSGFVNSVEFDNLCAEYSISRGYMYQDGKPANPGLGRFAERLYTKVLGRAGEKDGIEYWTLQIAGGACTPKEAAKGFFNSKEYKDKNTANEVYVLNLYETFMDRQPVADEISYHVNRLTSGTSRDDVLEGFANAPEFIGIMASFGL